MPSDPVSLTVRGEPRELMLAREGLSRAERRAALRAVNRGREVDNPRLARLAVAMARDASRRGEWLGVQLVIDVLIGLGFAGQTVASALHRGLDVETIVYGLMGALALCWFVRGFHRADRWRRAEAANRRVLEHAGQPFVEDTTLVPRARPTLPTLLQVAVIQWVVTDLLFGAVSQTAHTGNLSFGHLVRSGLIFASVITAWTLFDSVFPRWRTWRPTTRRSPTDSQRDAK
jgi:hypothetical protein